MIWDLHACVSGALSLRTLEESVQRVKRDLSAAIRAGIVDLDAGFRAPTPGHYARRLLYRNRQLDVSALVMTWGAGKSTAVHDDSRLVAVEGGVEGEIQVTQY